MFLILERLINKDKPSAPSQAPRDTIIRLIKYICLIIKIKKIVVKINSSLNNNDIKCLCTIKFKKQQKQIK